MDQEECNSSASSDDCAMDDELSDQVNDLMQKLEKSPYDYECHLQLLSLLHQLGSVESLREARENMNKHFPLAPDLWLSWIRDESERADTLEEKQQVLLLCDRAVQDYLSVDVWLEYCQLAICLLALPEQGAAGVRQVFERAVDAAGLHVTRGALLWQAYREFETCLHTSALESGLPEAVGASRDRVTSLFCRQLRVPLAGMDGTWREYEAWCAENTVPVCAAARRDYQTARQCLPELMQMETLLEETETNAESTSTTTSSSSSSALYRNYQRYLQLELASERPSERVLLLLERAVAACCLHAPLWQTYGRYLDAQLQPPHEQRLRVHRRAVRNVPWSAELWHRYMLAEERAGADRHRLHEVFSEALAAGLQTPADYQLIWLTWLDYTHRTLKWSTQLRANSHRPTAAAAAGGGNDTAAAVGNDTAAGGNDTAAGDNSTAAGGNDTAAGGGNDTAAAGGNDTVAGGNDTAAAGGNNTAAGNDGNKSAPAAFKAENGHNIMDSLRPHFEKASEHLSQMFGLEGDPGCLVLQYWACLEAGYGSVERAQQLWNDIMSQGFDTTATMWIKYLQLIRRHGTVKQTRRVFQQALERAADWPEGVMQEWTEFERQHGSLATWDDMCYRYRVRMKRVEQMREKQPKRKSDSEGAVECRAAKEGGKSRKRPKVGGAQPADRRDFSGGDRQKTSISASHTSSHAVSVTTTEATSTANTATAAAAAAGAAGAAAAAGAAGAAGAAAVTESVFKVPRQKCPDSAGGTGKRSRDTDRQADPPADKHFKLGEAVEDPERRSRTVFISNLDFDVDEDRLKSFFSERLNVCDVRLVKDYRGRSKGFAYLELSSITEVPAALKLDRSTLDQRPCFVSRLKSDPSSSSSAGGDSAPAFKYASGVEENKLFVRGLATTVTADELKTFFQQHGHVTDVRLVTYRNGHSKGIAYVEFDTKAAAAQAVQATDQQLLKDKRLTVAISNPPRRSTSTSQLGQSDFGGARSSNTASSARGRKPRMQLSFTPRAVRTGPATAGHTSAAGAASAKSNTQFRQLLQQ